MKRTDETEKGKKAWAVKAIEDIKESFIKEPEKKIVYILPKNTCEQKDSLCKLFQKLTIEDKVKYKDSYKTIDFEEIIKHLRTNTKNDELAERFRNSLQEWRSYS